MGALRGYDSDKPQQAPRGSSALRPAVRAGQAPRAVWAIPQACHSHRRFGPAMLRAPAAYGCAYLRAWTGPRTRMGRRRCSAHHSSGAGSVRGPACVRAVRAGVVCHPSAPCGACGANGAHGRTTDEGAAEEGGRGTSGVRVGVGGALGCVSAWVHACAVVWACVCGGKLRGCGRARASVGRGACGGGCLARRAGSVRRRSSASRGSRAGPASGRQRSLPCPATVDRTAARPGIRSPPRPRACCARAARGPPGGPRRGAARRTCRARSERRRRRRFLCRRRGLVLLQALRRGA